MKRSATGRTWAAPLVLVVVVLAAGCGGSDSSPTTDPLPLTSDPATTNASTTNVSTTPNVSSTNVSSTTSTTAAPVTTMAPPPILREEAPPLVEVDGWLASDVTSLEELEGQVVVVEFWTFGCYNCKNRIPYTQDLYAKYRDQGLEIVGIHSPEFAYEKEVDAIEAAMKNLGVTWPVVLDTERRTFREWQGRPAYWPRTYVLDQQGRVRFDHIGEGAYQELDDIIGYLLLESG